MLHANFTMFYSLTWTFTKTYKTIAVALQLGLTYTPGLVSGYMISCNKELRACKTQQWG